MIQTSSQVETFRQGVLVNSQREFINELNGLKADRYIEVFAHYGRTFWMVKLKHLTNGRTLVLKSYPSYFILEEGGKPLKQVSWNDYKL